jgi:hypothetical protein
MAGHSAVSLHRPFDLGTCASRQCAKHFVIGFTGLMDHGWNPDVKVIANFDRGSKSVLNQICLGVICLLSE